ncbi:hypothetical protein EV193_11538 [Herbihabitans rhizosphaerae]|uniref:DUF4118 domain-containing protein n=1 Tax=Herbihabitans rhizosphaerae TaxID=1872711 RepID=A0A4Q7KCG3_9PSEU|nr:hypothetical protein [Herbihabitans rhizosphaerae]RZS31159.1 hypothetical protein EV193_11538 [Herbihabitans rhizosphaerae]
MTRRVTGWFGFPLGFASAIVATILAVAIGATGHPIASVLLHIVVIAVTSTAPAALATAVTCWAMHAGFVLGRHGELATSGQAGHDAFVLLLNTLIVATLVSVARTAVRHHPEVRLPDQRKAGESVSAIRDGAPA